MKSPLLLSILMFFGFGADVKTFCQADLEIEICGIRSEKGQILMSLYNSPEQFPRNPTSELGGVTVKKDKIINGRLKHTIKGLKPGMYVLSLLDDENFSGDIDYTKIGIPTEGYGFSNNVKPFLSPPPYRKCLFEIKEGQNKIRINVQYKK